MHISSALVAILPTAFAAPTLVDRAGGPASKPIGPDCALSSPAPPSGETSFAVSPDFISKNQVFSYYLPNDVTSQPSFDELSALKQCVEQCNGFGTEGTCTSVYWGHNIEYTTFGVQNTGTACLFLSTPAQDSDLVPVNDGSHTSAKVVSITCRKP